MIVELTSCAAHSVIVAYSDAENEQQEEDVVPFRCPSRNVRYPPCCVWTMRAVCESLQQTGSFPPHAHSLLFKRLRSVEPMGRGGRECVVQAGESSSPYLLGGMRLGVVSLTRPFVLFRGCLVLQDVVAILPKRECAPLAILHRGLLAPCMLEYVLFVCKQRAARNLAPRLSRLVRRNIIVPTT